MFGVFLFLHVAEFGKKNGRKNLNSGGLFGGLKKRYSKSTEMVIMQ